MCGRFSLFAPRSDVEDRFEATFQERYQPRYNAAPGQSLPIVADVDPGAIHRAEWGLVPTWADERTDGGHINARSETAATKPTFREAFEGSSTGADVDATRERATAGRCLVPADGFYEWGDTPDGRQPYRLLVGDGDLFAMAGLWTRWTPSNRQAGLGEYDSGATDSGPAHNDPAGSGSERTASRYTFSILTTVANDVLADIHDRMPVVLDPEEKRAWLASSSTDTERILDPYEGQMEAYAVTEGVNDPQNDSPAVLEPLDA